MGSKAKHCRRCKSSHRKATPKQAIFANEYLVDLSATAAAIRAGYSRKSAGTLGYQLLQKTPIACLISHLAATRASRTAVDADRVLLGLQRIAFLRCSQLLDAAGNLKPVTEWPEDIDEVVAGLEIEQTPTQLGCTKKVKLPDRLRALELLGKHLRLFADVHLHQGDDDLLEAIARGRRRAGKGE